MQSYQSTLLHFVGFLAQKSIERLSDISHHTIRAYSAQLHRQGLAAKSIAQKLSALRVWFDYLAAQHQIDNNPAKGVKGPKIGKRLPQTLEVDEVTHFLDQIPNDTFVACRDKCMLELFYSSGVRLSELQGLKLKDIDLKDATARVLGKGQKSRIVPIGRKAIAALQDWLKQRAAYAESIEALFITEQGKPLMQRSIQARLSYWGKALGLSSRLHPHKLRHSCASHFLESASDLRAVQELLGHANLSTTQIYTHLDFQHLAQVYDAAHPRARTKKSD